MDMESAMPNVFTWIIAQGLSSIEILYQFNVRETEQKIADAKQELFNAIERADSYKFFANLKYLKTKDINPMSLQDKNGNDPLVVLARTCKNDISQHQIVQSKCHDAPTYFKKHVNNRNAGVLSKVRIECENNDQIYANRSAIHNGMLKTLIWDKYLNLGDYSILFADAIRLSQDNNVLNKTKSIEYFRYIDMIASGDDKKLAADFVSKYAKHNMASPKI